MPAKKILVVEDNHELADSLTDMLRLAGYDPHVSFTGREGVLFALTNKPDLTILDIRLPDISGYEVYNKIREDDWGKDAKILILTASESIENIAKNVNLPKEFVLFKPNCSVSQLIEKINDIIST